MNSTTSKLFKGVAFTVYPVSNVRVSRAFYEDALGLAVTKQWDDQWIEYDIGVGTFAITVADEKHKPGIHGATVGFEVNDFEAVIRHLKEKSVPIVDGTFDSPACRGCVIRDPDNNEIIIHAIK
jgi:catechol 2,3-dioxygenase-like lactoylglutathione lyase family enzyme